jgi:periplasmic divalent cation tolerance protein
MDYIVITTTTENAADALRIADALLERHLAGCVQIVGPIQSVYRWQGKIEHAEEYRCEIKTWATKFSAIGDFLSEVHPYDVPEIIAVPLVNISADYRKWLDEQLQDS